MSKVFYVDIDGTICTNTYGDYENAIPLNDRIDFFNKLYEEGHSIIYWTARGSASGNDWSELTKKQLNEWGVKCNDVKLGKPSYDYWIDDKAYNVDNLFNGTYFK